MNLADPTATQPAMPRPGILSIGNQLRYGTIALVVSSVVLAAGLLIHLSYQGHVRYLGLVQQERSQRAATEIGHYLADLQGELGYLARLPGLLDLPPQVQQDLLEGLTRHNKAYEVVAALDSAGHVISSAAPHGWTAPDDLANAPPFRRALEQAEKYIGPVELDTAARSPVMWLAAPVRDRQGKLYGALLAQVNLKFVSPVITSNLTTDIGYTYILDERGVLIAKPGGLPTGADLENISDRPFVQRLVSGEISPWLVYRGLEGVEVLGAMSPVPSVGWNVVTELPIAAAYAALHSMLRIMGAALLTAVALAAGLSLFFTRQIVAPLQQMTEAAAQVSAGNLETEVKTNRRDELGVLAATFNQMAAQLRVLVGSMERRMAELKQTEQALRESEERYRSLVEASPDAITQTDLEGRILICNRQAAALYGLNSVEEAVGLNAFDFLAPHERPRAVENTRRVLEEGTLRNIEYTFLKRDGTPFAGELNVAAIRGADGQPTSFIGVARDITERIRRREEAERAAAEIRRLKEFNEGIVQSMAEGITVEDPEGYFIFVNPAVATLLGYTAEEMLNQHWTMVVPPDQQPLVAAADERRARGQADRYELDLVRKDGTRLTVLISGSPRFEEGRFAGTMAVFSDITELKRLFEAERRRRQEAETLWAAMQALGATLDLQQVFDLILSELQKVVPYDTAAVQRLQDGRLVIIGGHGFPNPEEILGLSFDSTAPSNPASQVVRTRLPTIVDDVSIHYEDFKREPHAPAGIRGWMAVPLLFGDRLIGVITLDKREPGFYTPEHARLAMAFATQAAAAMENARLYTEVQARAAELAAALAALQEMDRLKSEFIQNVSHELRTPLSIIMGYAELLDGGELGTLQADQREPVAVIARRCRMLKKLVDDLTAILEAEAGQLKREPVDVAELVYALLSDFQAAAQQAKLSLSVQMAPGSYLISGDPAHLRRVLDNLVSNAFKFTPAGGAVTVSLQRQPRTDAPQDVILEVADTGIGIPPDKLERVFERFYQVNGSMSRPYGGVGLGLALVKEIVEAHDGQVSVQSVVGQGTTFRVCLPGLPRCDIIQAPFDPREKS